MSLAFTCRPAIASRGFWFDKDQGESLHQCGFIVIDVRRAQRNGMPLDCELASDLYDAWLQTFDSVSSYISLSVETAYIKRMLFVAENTDLVVGDEGDSSKGETRK